MFMLRRLQLREPIRLLLFPVEHGITCILLEKILLIIMYMMTIKGAVCLRASGPSGQPLQGWDASPLQGYLQHYDLWYPFTHQYET